MRLLVEGVRLEGLEEEAARRIARKIRRLLEEAAVRTPPTIASRQLVEEALRLSMALESLLEETCRDGGGPQ